MSKLSKFRKKSLYKKIRCFGKDECWNQYVDMLPIRLGVDYRRSDKPDPFWDDDFNGYSSSQYLEDLAWFDDYRREENLNEVEEDWEFLDRLEMQRRIELEEKIYQELGVSYDDCDPRYEEDYDPNYYDSMMEQERKYDEAEKEKRIDKIFENKKLEEDIQKRDELQRTITKRDDRRDWNYIE